MKSLHAINKKYPGFWGIWYWNQKSHDEYVYKYSGGLGTYCANHIPLAIYAPEVNCTYFCYGGRQRFRNRLVHMVAYYDHSKKILSAPTAIVDKKTDDAHDNPVISLDKSGYLWIFSSSHGLSRPSYIWKSRKPYNIDAFDLISITNFSYPQPWYMKAFGFIFLHTKYINNNRCLMWNTSPDGIHWTDPQQLAFIEKGHYAVSWPYGSKIGICFNYHPDPGGLNYRTNLYYVETSNFGKTWQNIFGDTIQTPIIDIKNSSLIHDYAAEGLKIYIHDMNYDLVGRPIILFTKSKGYESGPQNGPRIWTTAHWTGTQWEILGSIQSDSNYDVGCLHVLKETNHERWRIIGPTGVGPQPFNPGGEIEIWDSIDQGKKWEKKLILTKNSIMNHTYVRKPLNNHPDFAAFWADGHARKSSLSNFYISDINGEKIIKLPRKL